MSALRPELATALDRLYRGAGVESLPGDASTRRFHRLILAGGGTRIVMDYGAAFEGETDDVRLARIFERAALPVARVLEVIPEAGCLILEDLGDVTLEKASPAEKPRLYRSAVSLAADIAARGSDALSSSERSAGPALDEDRFRFEMRFFLEHFIGSHLGRRSVPTGLAEELEALARDVASHPRVFCHRDYHSRNLMVRSDESLCMVDIQDARWGPDTYDIASLLCDAYADVNEAEAAELLERYRLERRGPPERGAFERRFHLVATQRMIKALGTFGYQVGVLGRDRYRDAIPRTVQRLRQSLPLSPSTQPLAERLAEAGAC